MSILSYIKLRTMIRSVYNSFTCIFLAILCNVQPIYVCLCVSMRVCACVCVCVKDKGKNKHMQKLSLCLLFLESTIKFSRHIRNVLYSATEYAAYSNCVLKVHFNNLGKWENAKKQKRKNAKTQKRKNAKTHRLIDSVN
jgi:hypothetical protein